MAFRFKLQSVLDHRSHLEDLALGVFADKLKVQKECEGRIIRMEDDMMKVRDELARHKGQGIPSRIYAQAGDYLTMIRLLAYKERQRLKGLAQETEKARLKLVEAAKDRKAMEVLRDRHREEYERRERMAEQRLLDEVAVQGHLRRTRQ